MELMRNKAYKPLGGEELAKTMGVKDVDAFKLLLDKMEKRGEVILTRKEKYGLPEKMGLVVGRLQRHGNGFGFVISDAPDTPDTYVSAENLNGAMHNDRVVVRPVAPIPRRAAKPEGEVIRVLERANRTVVGTFERIKGYGFVTPDDPRIGQDIFIPEADKGKAKNNDKVVVEITRWPEKRRNPEGQIIEVLGKYGAPGVDVLSIVRKYELPEAFPPGVLKEAEKIPAEVRPEDLPGRRDLRHLRMVTIDGEDAKDLDDAVSIEAMPGGLFRLGVHIADVAYYVKEGSKLDQEAFKRGTSVYLVDRVIPMLPPKLSNGICSLNAKVDRLAMSVLMDVDSRGQVGHYEIFPSVIHISQRMTYDAVRKILVDQDQNLLDRYRDLVEDFRLMESLCRILYRKRLDRGAIDFEFPESKVKLDPEGKPLEIEKRIRTISEHIIEEFMVLANETVAAHMRKQEMPFVYRVHQQPDQEDLEQLNEFLHTLGYHVKADGHGRVHPKSYQAVLDKVAGRPEAKTVGIVMLRSMKHASYHDQCLGHFGLAATDYCHFTSPIRRYPDLVIHRVIRETVGKGSLAAKRRAKLAEMMPQYAEQSSLREKVAEEAERESVDMKKVEYMQAHLGEVYPGHVSGVMPFGLFVELDNTVEGLVHVSTMTDDYYQYHEKQLAMSGRHTGKTYRLGTPVTVQVARVDVDKRQVDFELIEDARQEEIVPKTKGKKNGPRKEEKDPSAVGKKAPKKAKATQTEAKKAKTNSAEPKRAPRRKK
ncbi:MAG: ribonuclease R [Bacillota bacterium]